MCCFRLVRFFALVSALVFVLSVCWLVRFVDLSVHPFICPFVCLFVHSSVCLSVCRSVCSFVSWLVDPHGRLLCCSSVVVVVVCLSCFCLLLSHCSIVLVGVSCGPGGFQHRRDGLPVPMPGWPLPSVPSSWLLHVWLHRDTKLCGGNNQCGCLPTSLQKSQTLCALARNHHGDVSVLCVFQKLGSQTLGTNVVLTAG